MPPRPAISAEQMRRLRERTELSLQTLNRALDLSAKTGCPILDAVGRLSASGELYAVKAADPESARRARAAMDEARGRQLAARWRADPETAALEAEFEAVRA